LGSTSGGSLFALQAAYPALGALTKRHLHATLLGAVWQDTGLQDSYLTAAGGTLFGKLSHSGYSISGGRGLGPGASKSNLRLLVQSEASRRYAMPNRPF
jgi:hypothetical protein